jgi:hypothetical protein
VQRSGTFSKSSSAKCRKSIINLICYLRFNQSK